MINKVFLQILVKSFTQLQKFLKRFIPTNWYNTKCNILFQFEYQKMRQVVIDYPHVHFLSEA